MYINTKKAKKGINFYVFLSSLIQAPYKGVFILLNYLNINLCKLN